MTASASIEGHKSYYFNATFFTEIIATTSWQKVSFVDYTGDGFDSSNIRLSLIDTDPVDFSFDPEADATYTARSVSGQLHAEDRVIHLNEKRATEIWVKSHGANNSTIHIMAWRA